MHVGLGLISNCFRKNTMHCYDCLKLIIGLNSGKNIRIKPSGPNKYISIRSRQVSDKTGYLLKKYIRNSSGPEKNIGIARLSD